MIIANIILAALTAYYGAKELPIEKCRVSAVMKNHIWDGEQRDISETKEAYIVSFEVREQREVKFTGIPEGTKAKMYPVSEAARLLKAGEIWRLRVEAGAQYVVQFEGLPDVHVFADKPFDYQHVEDEIYFGPGEHEAGIIAPKSGQTVCIDRGAVVHGEIYLDHVTNVTVTGRGILDCSRFERADVRAREFRKARNWQIVDTEHACFPCVIHGCSKVRFEGITIRDTPFWGLVVRSGSTDIDIDGVKIVGQWRYNSDGIDISASSEVRVRNCFVRSFDDCLVVLGAYLDASSFRAEKISFENCRLWCDWGACFKLWSQPYTNTFANITMKNCRIFKAANGTVLQVKDTCGSADTRIGDISFEEIEIDDERDEMMLGYVACLEPRRDFGNQKFVPIENPTGFHSTISNVLFKNIVFPMGAPSKLKAQIITSIDGQEIKNVRFQKCPRMEVEKRGKGVEE